jgi:hypothetical protein
VAVAGRFEAADGSLGTVVANTTADAQDVELTFAPGTAATVVFSADGQELERLPPGPGPVRVRLALPPLGTRVVVQR